MFNKSIITVAVLGAATFSANSATLEEVRVIATTAQNNAAHALIQNSTQDKNITANKDAIAANKDAIAANKADIATNKANIDKVNEKADLANRANDVQNKQIAGLQSANLAQDKLIATNKADIASNKANIEANKNAIAANYAEMKNNFAAVNSRIDKLDDKMKKGFAAQAALNGLFQPYSVGKFNVTAAIGGYDSEQAMALGTGYRFNENFALKAGIASDLSGFDHVTYNIGANFEF